GIAGGADSGGIGLGQYPGGPAAFFSYPDNVNNFSAASEYTLYRFAGDAVQGNLIHYAVAGLAIEDGYHDPWNTSYFQDPARAACDPTGLVVKYYRAIARPGSDDPAKSPFGSITNIYLNGLEIHTGEDFYNMLDGLLSAVA